MTLLLASMFFAQAPVKIVYAAGYIPNVQFAPFYVALEKGYYLEEGVDLTLDYTVGPDVFKLTALGKVQLASADPDAFLRATQQGMDLIHIATLYQSYPIALISTKDILNAQDLKRSRIGISGTFGSSYLGFKALLHQIGLSLEEVNLVSIGFTQVQAMEHGTVDAVVGYINHEPIRLQRNGQTVYTLPLNDSNNLPGVGLMVQGNFAGEHPQAVAGFLRATFRGLVDVTNDPEGALDLISRTHLKEISAGPLRESELRVLKATIPFWHSAYTKQNGLGQCDPGRWQRLAEWLVETDHISPLNWRQLVDFSFTFVPDQQDILEPAKETP